MNLDEPIGIIELGNINVKCLIFKIAEDNIKEIEKDENNFKRYDFLIKLFDKAEIINNNYMKVKKD